jgi:hypothetical protein
MPRKPIKPEPLPDRLEPVVPTPAEATAVKAIFRGDPTPDQCHRFMEFLLLRLCGATRRSFDPASTTSTAFAEGQRDIALQLNGIKHLDIRALKQDTKETENG